MPTLREVLKATRPISYDNDDAEWEYSTRGSCVVLRLNERLYGATALHVPKSYNPSQIMIPYEEGDDHFLPMCEAFNVSTTEMEDTDHQDILFIEIWREKLDTMRLKATSIVDITADTHKETNAETKYMVSGYPFSLNSVDYDAKRIHHQAVHIYAGVEQRDCYLGVDRIRFHSDADLKSSTDRPDDNPFNGLSGGGVFSLTPNGLGDAIVAFQGILLRATASSRIGYVLKTDFIKHYLVGQQRESPSRSASAVERNQ